MASAILFYCFVAVVCAIAETVVDHYTGGTAKSFIAKLVWLVCGGWLIKAWPW